MGKKKKRRSWFVTLIKLVVLVAAVAVGWKYGIGPLLSMQKGQESVLYVVNDTETVYNSSMGWRRDKRVLQANSNAKFALYVGMKETQKLTLTPQGGGAEKTIAVPLEPDCELLINVDRATTYYAYEPERANQQQLRHLDDLGRQLAGRQNPAALDAILANLLEIGASTQLESIDSLFIDLTKYTPHLVMISDFSLPPEPGERAKPLLTTETQALSFANGRMTWNGATPQTTRADLKLERPVQVAQPGNFTTTIDAGQGFELTATPEVTTMRMYVGKPATLNWENVSYSGSWSYDARREAGKGWTWSWGYGGSARVGQQEWGLSLVFPERGNVRASIEKMEIEPGM